MTTSQIFYTDKYKKVEKQVVKFLNSRRLSFNPRMAASTRAVGDTIQAILSEKFQSILGGLCKEYSASFARRAMADFAFTGSDDFYYVVDVKTHRLNTTFNMPNLISVRRLAQFYEDDSHYFVVLIVKYNINNTEVKVERAHFLPIEFLAWDCLTIGALGWGQIQIAKANVININQGYSRKKWMLELCRKMTEFYPEEIDKIKARIKYFKHVKRYWEKKPWLNGE